MLKNLMFRIIVVLATVLMLSCPPAVVRPTIMTSNIAAMTINIAMIAGVVAPVLGATPVLTISETEQYTGTVVWSGTPSTFAASTAYTATITLTAKDGFTLTGVVDDFFTVAGATNDSSLANSGIVTAVFPPTGDGRYNSATIGILRYVPAGRFQRDGTSTNISVIAKPYRMSQYEITRIQFSTIMGADPSDNFYSSGGTDPVQNVNWYHAIAFCNKLSLLEGLTPVYSVTVSGSPVNWSTLEYGSIPTTYNEAWNGATATWSNSGYRLPTEMEWIWAAMGAPMDGRGGGTNTTGYRKAFAGSTGSNSLGDYAVFGYFDSTGDVGETTTAQSNPVGSRRANELGLYDMSGNVWEWTWDWYAEYAEGTLVSDAADGTGRGAISRTMIRVGLGGDWALGLTYCAMASRSYFNPELQYSSLGFRVVRP